MGLRQEPFSAKLRRPGEGMELGDRHTISDPRASRHSLIRDAAKMTQESCGRRREEWFQIAVAA